MVTSTRSIGDKVRAAFRTLNGLLIAVAAVAVLALLIVRHSANEALDVEARLNNIAIKIQAGAFAASMHEKDFLLDIKEMGVEKAKQKDATLVASAVSGLMRLSENGRATAAEQADRARFQSIHKQARSYQEAFAGMIAAKERRGFVDTGAEGSFREAAHQIERESGVTDRVRIALLLLRRSEKDYMLRGDEKYIALTLDNVKKLETAVDRSSMPKSKKESAKAAAEHYREHFRILVRADSDVAAKSAVCRDALARLRDSAANAADAGGRASEKSLATASTVTVVSIALVVLISIGAVVAGFLYSS